MAVKWLMIQICMLPQERCIFCNDMSDTFYTVMIINMWMVLEHFIFVCFVLVVCHMQFYLSSLIGMYMC